MELTLTRQTPAQHIVWLDVVRLVAMFTVVCCHCTDPFNFYPGTSPDIVDIKFWGAVYGAALRPCVPLFVMITGALLLPVRGDASAFYKKRIPRVFFPFFIWSVIYNLFPWITGLLGVEPKVILDFFPYSGEEVMRQSLAVSLGYIAEMPFNFSLLDVHMWYIYLLIGLYLYLPIFSAWVEKASERAKLWFLAAWGVTLLLPYYTEFAAPYLWGTCSWNSFGMLYYFAGFNGYLLLGHYLRNHNWTGRQLCGIGIPMFAIGRSEPDRSGFRTLFHLLFAECSNDDYPRVYALQAGQFPFGAHQESIGKLDALWFWSLYDTLFLYRTERSPDACYPCSYLSSDTLCRSRRFLYFLVSGGNGIPLFREADQVGAGVVWMKDCLSLKEEI